LSSKNNPFILVNSFFKNYPNSSEAKDNIDVNLINLILGNHISEFNLSSNEFNVLNSIKPVKFNLPVDKSFTEFVGNYERGKGKGKAGVYVFTNKQNGYNYIGSSISLANRLKTGYFVPNLQNRVIDLAIKEVGLNQFYLSVYLIPENLIGSNSITKLKKNLSLALEQILILQINPEYNVLKVVGSAAGNKRSLESILPSIIKNSKPIYLYDQINKELIYIAESRVSLAKFINYNSSNIVRLFKSGGLYLNQFIFSDKLLNESEYTINLKSDEDLLAFLNEIRIVRKKELSLNLTKDSLRTYRRKKVQLINIKTQEVLEFESLTATVRYIKELDPKFAKAGTGALSDSANKGTIYKGLYKVEYTNYNDS
jgi:hypothetical protein